MAGKITVGPLGINGGFAGTNKGRAGRRGAIRSWSSSSARSNVQFLRSVEPADLPPDMLAYTLTVGRCPDTPGEWARLRKRLATYLTRLGAVCWHMCTEWQARGVPHLHGCAGFPRFRGDEPRDLRRYWVRLTSHLATGARSQDVLEIETSRMSRTVGWLQYMGKHTSRGARHYQRAADAMPDAWDKSGRMWARGGSWPTSSRQVEVEPTVMALIRRTQDRAARAEARARLRRALRYGDDRSAEAARVALAYQRRLVRGMVDQDQPIPLGWSGRRALADLPDWSPLALDLIASQRRGRSRMRGFSGWSGHGDAERVLAWAVVGQPSRYRITGDVPYGSITSPDGRWTAALVHPDDGVCVGCGVCGGGAPATADLARGPITVCEDCRDNRGSRDGTVYGADWCVGVGGAGGRPAGFGVWSRTV